MDSLTILPDVNIKSLFACHGQFGHFPPQYVPLPTSLGPESIFMCQIMIIPLL